MIKRSLILGLSAAISIASSGAFADTLQETYLQALANDHQLKADEAGYRAGLEAKTSAFSGLLPQLNAEATLSKTDTTVTDHSGTSTSSSLFSSSNVKEKAWGATLTQPLFNMAAWFNYQQGIALSDVAEAQFSADQQSLIIRVSQAYLNALRSIDNLKTAIAEENALSHQLEQTRQRFEVGLTAITDVHEAQAAFDTAVATTLEARGNVGIAFEQVEVLTSKPTETIAPLSETFPITAPEPLQRSEWVDFAVKNNFALKTAKLKADAAEQNARAMKAGHLPTVSAVASYNDSDSDGSRYSQSFDTTTDSTYYGLQIDMPLFTGGRVSSDRRRSYEESMQVRELYNKAQRDTIQSARSLHLSVVTNVALIKATKQATISSQSALEATQAGYEVGTRNLVDVLVAQRSLYEAQRNYDNSRYDYIFNMLQLKEAAGNLTPNDILQLNQWMDGANQVSRAQYE